MPNIKALDLVSSVKKILSMFSQYKPRQNMQVSEL